MKQLFSILIFLCFLQNTAKAIHIQGEIKNFDKTERENIKVYLSDINNEIFTEIALDTLGKFDMDLERWKSHTLEIHSLKYEVYRRSLRFIGNRTKSIKIKLQERKTPLSEINTQRFDCYTIKNKSDKSIELKGSVFDGNGEPFIFATVAIKKSGSLIAGTQTDFDGNYQFDSLSVGTYDVVVRYVGYQTKTVSNINIFINETVILNVELNQGVELHDMNHPYTIPLIELDNTTQGQIFGSWEIQRSPIKN